MIDGSLIKYYRKKNDLTQAELAHGICSITYLSKVENNKMEASTDVLNELCSRLGINASLITHSSGNEEVKQLLESWNTYMNLNDFKNAREIYKKIKAEYNNPVHYSTMNLYNLFLFRYYQFNNQLEKADELYQTIINLESSLSPKGTYYYYKYLGIYYKNKLRYYESFEYLQKAEKIGEELNLRDSHLYHFLTLGAMKLNKQLRSVLYAQKALKLYQDELNYERITSVNMVLALNYILINEIDLAKDILTKLLSTNVTKEDPNIRGQLYHNLGYAYFQEEKYELAIQNFKLALTNKRAESINALRTIFLITHAYVNLKQNVSSEKWLNRAKEIIEKTNNERYKIKFKVLEFLIEEKQNDEEFANYLKNTAIPFFKQSGENDETAQYLGLLADNYYHNHLYKPAADYYKEKLKVDKHF